MTAKKKKRFKATTESKHNLPVAPNLLKHNFTVARPDSAYCSDIKYIRTAEGWLYRVVVMDLFSCKVVGWSINKCMPTKLVVNALQMAIWRCRPSPGLIFHSDRGSQYCSKEFQELLRQNRMKSSMSRKGDCWDNSVAESFLGTLKTEQVFISSSYLSREDAKRELFDYIEMFCNGKRCHSCLGYLSPKDFEKKIELRKAA